METVRKFLVPVDFSEDSARSLKYAVALAQQTHAELLVLHVAEHPDAQPYWLKLAVMEGYPAPKAPASDAINELLRARSLDLANFIQSAAIHRRLVKIGRRVEMGNKRKQIARVAREEKVDLVVFSVPRPSLFSYLVERGKLLKMVWRLPCPMLLRTNNPELALETLSRSVWST